MQSTRELLTPPLQWDRRERKGREKVRELAGWHKDI